MKDKWFRLALAVLVILALMFVLDHGLFVGSVKSEISPGVVQKRCQYLFITGVTELPAHGSAVELLPAGSGIPPGVMLPNMPDNLYCRLFAD